MDRDGLTGGTNFQFNSGCMTTSAGPNQGRSKAIPMSWVLICCEIPYGQNVSFAPAWTPVDMHYITTARIPLAMRLAQAVEDK